MAAVEGKSIILDMNEKTITVDYDNSNLLYAVVYVANGASLNITGNGSIDLTTGDTKAGKYDCVAYMFWKHGTTGKLIIENGNYHANNVEDSMIYTNGSGIVTVEDGTFILDAVGANDNGNNGCPWIFNCNGSNSRHVVVNGGTYNFNISEQFWDGEVQLGEGLAVREEEDGLYHVYRPADVTVVDQNGNETLYKELTLAEVIEAAQDGDTIILNKDYEVNSEDVTALDIAKLNSDRPKDNHVTFFHVTGKSITIDLNGNQIFGDCEGLEDSLAGIFSTRNDGHLTLKGNGTVEVDSNGATVYAMIINLDDTSSITIESGNYILDRAVSAMIDTRSNEGVIVNGGTFELGNVADEELRNGQAWMFNAKGQNTRHVIVTGGSFNTDILHQYYPFEVSMSEELALEKDGDMYTVVPAVAYVNEQEFSGKWYTNNVGYATLEEALAAVEGPKTSWDGQVSEQEYVTLTQLGKDEGLEIEYYESLSDAFEGSDAL